tara:strand:+ start:1071 stop:1517 length:447 start_codon:yes stop_codon:yes gene_type:complete
MATKKYKRAAPSKSVPKGTLKISSKKAKVPAPKGHHWMFEGGRYYLMKGDYKPHPGASEFAEFKLVDHAKAKKANRGMRVDVTSPTGMSYYEKGGVNAAGNYTQPGMRKRLFNKIKAGTKGGNAGQWSARKAQMLAKEYKAKGGGYKN